LEQNKEKECKRISKGMIPMGREIQGRKEDEYGKSDKYAAYHVRRLGTVFVRNEPHE